MVDVKNEMRYILVTRLLERAAEAASCLQSVINFKITDTAAHWVAALPYCFRFLIR